jgi:hypothetical protein
MPRLMDLRGQSWRRERRLPRADEPTQRGLLLRPDNKRAEIAAAFVKDRADERRASLLGSYPTSPWRQD